MTVPGKNPWCVYAHWDHHYQPFYLLEGDRPHDGDPLIRDRHEANARLMSAAPELLEALENIGSLTEEKRLAIIARAKGVDVPNT